MKIQPIVEGYGEVDAVPVLIRRLRDVAGAYELEVGHPIRKRRTELIQETSLRTAVKLALLKADCSAVLIVFDADDACPKELAPQVLAWAKSESGSIPVAVVIANREYEAWFIAVLESLHGKRGVLDTATSHPNPESKRGAKEYLELHMSPKGSYRETTDQAALSALFDMGGAYRKCRSFKKFVKAFGDLATGIGVKLTNWPPPSWTNS